MGTYSVAQRSRPKRALRIIGECRRALRPLRLERRNSGEGRMSSDRNLIRRREALAALTGLGFAPKLLRAELADPGPAMLPNYLAGRLNTLAAKWRAEVDGLRT